MGNSTLTLQTIFDAIETMGDVDPTAKPGSYSSVVSLAIANDALNALIARRFNWKWNRALAPTFLTNSFQQDYPMVGLNNIGWLESAWWLEINSTMRPIPIGGLAVARDLDVVDGRYAGIPQALCWMYAKNMQIGTWPGPRQTFTPLRGQGGLTNNPSLSMLDSNGNILVLTLFGVTGANAPVMPANSPEGQTIVDGSCTWTVCSPQSQSFRINPLPASSTPVYEVHVQYQMKAQKFTSLSSTLDPIPDDYANHFRTGVKAYCYAYSSDRTVRAEFPQMHKDWLASMVEAEAQADREPDAYRLVPATSIVDPYNRFRNPNDPSRPY